MLLKGAHKYYRRKSGTEVVVSLNDCIVPGIMNFDKRKKRRPFSFKPTADFAYSYINDYTCFPNISIYLYNFLI